MHGSHDVFTAPVITFGVCTTQKHGLRDQLLLPEGAHLFRHNTVSPDCYGSTATLKNSNTSFLLANALKFYQLAVGHVRFKMYAYSKLEN